MSNKKLIAFTEVQLYFIAEHRATKGGSFQAFVSTAINERIKQLNGIKLFLEEREAAKKNQKSEIETLVDYLGSPEGKAFIQKLLTPNTEL